MSWSPKSGPVPCKTPEDAFLAEATWNYFLAPSPAKLQPLASPGRAHPAREMYQAALMTQAAHAAIDDESAIVVSSISLKGGCVTCRAGCSACCNQAIPAYPFEAALIGIYLNNRPEARDSFMHAYGLWHAKTRDMRDDFMAWAERCYRDNSDDGRFRLSDFQAPCPFLADNLCQIYPVRPYVCRAYLALSESCPHPEDPDQKPGFQGLDVGAYTNYQAARNGFVKLLFKRFGIDPENTRNRLMPDLVYTFLNNGVTSLLDACVMRSARPATGVRLAA